MGKMYLELMYFLDNFKGSYVHINKSVLYLVALNLTN